MAFGEDKDKKSKGDAGKPKTPAKSHLEQEKQASLLAPSEKVPEIVWRGILKGVRYHQPLGVVQTNGKTGTGWGIFIVEPIATSKLPEGTPINNKVYSRHEWSVKGTLIGDPEKGMELICHGKFVIDPKYGEQFDASVLVEPLPDVHDLEYIKQWLVRKSSKSTHRIVGMTPKRAEKAVNHFGDDIMNAMGDPKRLAEIFPEKICQDMAESFLQEGRSYRLHLFFLENGFHQGHANSLIIHLESQFRDTGKAWTVDSVIQQTRQKPYWVTDVSGIGFLVADALAKKLGMKEDDPARLLAGLHYSLELREREGHTATTDRDLLEIAASKNVLRVDAMENPKKAHESLKNILSGMTSDEGPFMVWKLPDKSGFTHQLVISKRSCGYAERYIAHNLLDSTNQKARRMISSEALEKHFSIESASQRSAMLLATSKQMGVLTGGPGTGKTTCLKSIAESAVDSGIRVKLCTPSGKAASRLRQATGMQATTIHTLFGFFKTDDASNFSPDNPYPADLFIIDEASMVDVHLMKKILYSISPHAAVLLVGDSEQLPSVGPGRIFGDIIDSGKIPVGRLTENRRQGGASEISGSASRVSEGRIPCKIHEDLTKIPSGVDSFFAAQWTDVASNELVTKSGPWVINDIQTGIHHLLSEGVPVESIQVLTPQKKGDLGIMNMNEPMTSFLNPAKSSFLKRVPKEQRTALELGWRREGLDEKPNMWTIGDRVIQVKNNRESQVFNGDMGVVFWVEPESDDHKPAVAVYYENGDLPRFDLAMSDCLRFLQKKPEELTCADLESYGEKINRRYHPENGGGRLIWYYKSNINEIQKAGVLTIHKTQGSEYDYVFMVLHSQHWFIASRPLLYTGMTRAKKGLRIYLSEKSTRKAVKNLGAERETLLGYRLKNGWLD